MRKIIEPKDNLPLAITLFRDTFGVTQGVRHNIGAIGAMLYDPQAVMGVLSVNRAGEQEPHVAVAHIGDPLVTAASVVTMQTTLRGTAWQKFRKPATSCVATVLCGPEADPHPFINAAKQNFWGCPVRGQVMRLPAFTGKNPVRVAYNVAQGSFFSPLSAWKLWEVTFRGHVQNAVMRHHRAASGQMKRSTRLRLWLADLIFGGVDVQRPNLTGHDYQRGPVLQIFDLRRPKVAEIHPIQPQNAPK